MAIGSVRSAVVGAGRPTGHLPPPRIQARNLPSSRTDVRDSCFWMSSGCPESKCRGTYLDFTETRDSEWKWHQLGHMQVCNSLQTDNHASTPPLSFLHAGCPSCRSTNSVKSLKLSSKSTTYQSNGIRGLQLTDVWYTATTRGQGTAKCNM